MKILVLNCGSSSLKFQLIETDEQTAREGKDRTLAKGEVEDTGGTATLHYEVEGKKPVRDAVGEFQHKAAVEKALAVLTDPETGVIPHKDEIGAVGHRVVHGGERFKTSVLIDEEVIEGIEANIALAPLHNPANLQGYRAAKAVLPDAPQVAVFDTSFHQTMPPEAFLYALPYDQYQRFGIRRFGFHGTSHRFVSARAAALLGRSCDDPEMRLITCHLGNGASVCAIRGGKSVDTSMGFTPLEGLVMGTRCGDLDPAALLYIMSREELGAAEASALMNKRSGLLGLRASPTTCARCWRRRRRGTTAPASPSTCSATGCGNTSPPTWAPWAARTPWSSPAASAKTHLWCGNGLLHGLDALGLAADPARNDAARGTEAEISPAGARSRVFVIPTDEELLIARDAFRIVSGL